MTTKCLEDSSNCNINETEHISNSQVLSDGRRTIAEDYLEGRINLHVHIRFHDEEFCAVFDRNSEIGSLRNTIDESPKANLITDNSSEQKVSMLVEVTQLMEIPQMLTGTVRNAWLKPINDVNNCIADTLELSPLLTFVFGKTIKDRKLVPFVGSVPCRQDKLPNEMVKGTSVVVKHLSNPQTNVIRHRRNVVEAIDLISRSIINIFGDNIGFEVTEGRDISVQSITLLSGPVEFSHRTFKGGHYE
jgi:hypothetical protein